MFKFGKAQRSRWSGAWNRDGVRAWARRHAFGFFSSLGELVRRPITSALTVMVLALALTLPLGLAWTVNYLTDWTEGIDRTPSLSVFLGSDAGESTAMALSSEWSAWAEVLAVDPISPEMGLAETLGHLGVEAHHLAVLDNPMPWVLELSPNQDADVVALQARLMAHPQVDQVIVDLVWLERLDLMLMLGQRVVWILGLLLLLAFLFVIAHTIRLEVHQRRHQIEVMALVGATPAFIRRPFLYSGFWFGISASFLALLILVVSLSFLSGPLEALGLSYQLDAGINGPTLGQSLALMLGMGGIGVAGSWMAVHQQLAGIWPE